MTVVGGAGDLATDILATTPTGRRIPIQAKRYSPGTLVGSQDVQKVNGTYRDIHRCDLAAVDTTSALTEPAAAFRARTGIRMTHHRALALWAAAHLGCRLRTRPREGRALKYAADDHRLAQVHLQAAVAQAALGEFDPACERLGVVLALRGFDLLATARATAAFLDSITMVTGNERATGKLTSEADEQTESLDERVRPTAAVASSRTVEAEVAQWPASAVAASARSSRSRTRIDQPSTAWWVTTAPTHTASAPRAKTVNRPGIPSAPGSGSAACAAVLACATSRTSPSGAGTTRTSTAPSARTVCSGSAPPAAQPVRNASWRTRSSPIARTAVSTEVPAGRSISRRTLK